eukprot:Amastigsp_a2952_122.p2 type:complete len:195 gc:universal Amastigsp_a2952_122:960-376(-)
MVDAGILSHRARMVWARTDRAHVLRERDGKKPKRLLGHDSAPLLHNHACFVLVPQRLLTSWLHDHGRSRHCGHSARGCAALQGDPRDACAAVDRRVLCCVCALLVYFSALCLPILFGLPGGVSRHGRHLSEEARPSQHRRRAVSAPVLFCGRPRRARPVAVPLHAISINLHHHSLRAAPLVGMAHPQDVQALHF